MICRLAHVLRLGPCHVQELLSRLTHVIPGGILFLGAPKYDASVLVVVVAVAVAVVAVAPLLFLILFLLFLLLLLLLLFPLLLLLLLLVVVVVVAAAAFRIRDRRRVRVHIGVRVRAAVVVVVVVAAVVDVMRMVEDCCWYCCKLFFGAFGAAAVAVTAGGLQCCGSNPAGLMPEMKLNVVTWTTVSHGQIWPSKRFR